MNFVRTYVKLDDRAAREYEALLHKPENQEVEAMMMTWADEIEAAGLQKGRLQGMRDLVLHLLTQRFGDPSEKVRRRIGAITSSRELTRLAERLGQVHSAEELGLA